MFGLVLLVIKRIFLLNPSASCMDCIVCVLPKFMCWKPNFLCYSIWRWDLLGGNRSWRWSPYCEICDCIRRDMWELASLSAVCGRTEKPTICKPGTGLSSELDHAGTLTTAFPVSRTVGINCCKPVGLWYSVMTAWTYQYITQRNSTGMETKHQGGWRKAVITFFKTMFF